METRYDQATGLHSMETRYDQATGLHSMETRYDQATGLHSFETCMNNPERVRGLRMLSDRERQQSPRCFKGRLVREEICQIKLCCRWNIS
jgi:hypothetical protein